MVRPASPVHFLYGLLTGVFYFLLSPWFALLHYAAFHVYEVTEYLLIRDRPWLDLREYYAGLTAAGLAVLALQIYMDMFY